ncbi:MAG: MFS transporter [Leptolyngbyaceae cyanobacterium SL_7_1]|nr:MFS transporter [Leptolyngbyaceae cyanobacterium SL_7_1]
MKRLRNRIGQWLPDLDYRVWLLSMGRLLSQLGTGFTLFYAPIFFVNQVGLSASAVGAGIGSGSISGIVGRIMGGSMADSPRWGRRKTLLISAAISAIAALVFVVATDLPTFVLGNLLMGLGVGLYWPPTEAVVADLTSIEQRNEAFAITRLGDSLGLGLGVVLGGALISGTGNYRALFVIDGISFIVFFGVIYWAIAETLQAKQSHTVMQGWAAVLRDRVLLVYAIVNVLFTTYLALVNSAIPLYFSNFLSLPNAKGFAAATLSGLFAWHVGLTALTQLPVARTLTRFRYCQSLMLSIGLWGIGFGFVWLTGITLTGHLGWAAVSLAVLAIATVSYMPAASALVVSLAPVALRGVYLSVNSLCWAVGYFIGPTIGGWAMDQPTPIAHGFWIATALSIIVGIGILSYLDRSDRLAGRESHTARTRGDG